jgi:hypothetical protein
MTHYIRQIVAFLTMTTLVWVCWLGIIFQASPASAAIRALEEVPGQLVYQSRQTLKEQIYFY